MHAVLCLVMKSLAVSNSMVTAYCSAPALLPSVSAGLAAAAEEDDYDEEEGEPASCIASSPPQRTTPTCSIECIRGGDRRSDCTC